jgi:hypothetical protein
MMFQNMNVSLYMSEKYDENKSFCMCLPECTQLNYEGEISQDDIRYFNRSLKSNE